MIDTVVLLLEEENFTISDPEKFDPHPYWCSTVEDHYLYGNTHQNFRSKQYATKQELRKGIYKPRLTVFKGFYEKGIRKNLLKIELSLPHLKNHNNFIELSNFDLPIIVEKLQLSLKDMGVLITRKDLKKSPVCAVHYSKNILLPGYITSSQVIKEIGKGDYSLHQDIEKTTFRNSGQLFKLHTNSWEFVIYDKVKDLRKTIISDKRSEEDNNLLQLHILDKIDPSFEVLRLEARLNKRRKIKQLFKKLNISTEITLEGIFDFQKSQDVLLHYLYELKGARHDILDYKTTNEQELLHEIITNNTHLTLRNKIMFYGFIHALETYDIREIKEMLREEKNKRSWYRIIKESKKLNLSGNVNFFAFLESQLVEFNPLKIEPFQENYYERV